MTPVTFTIEVEREEDDRWIAEIPALPGAMAKVRALAARVIAARLEHCEVPRAAD